MGDIMRPIPFEELLTRIFVKLLASSVKPVPLPSALPLARTRSSRKILSLPG